MPWSENSMSWMLFTPLDCKPSAICSVALVDRAAVSKLWVLDLQGLHHLTLEIQTPGLCL